MRSFSNVTRRRESTWLTAMAMALRAPTKTTNFRPRVIAVYTLVRRVRLSIQLLFLRGAIIWADGGKRRVPATLRNTLMVGGQWHPARRPGLMRERESETMARSWTASK